MVTIPTKPFASYKWRWAVLTPTESLNEPSVFLGILRVLRKHENTPPSSPLLIPDLYTVQRRTGTNVNLVRSANRNIIRNSGQYWKALGLLEEHAHGNIILSSFGKKVADGRITQTEFATTVVKTLELPNARIQQDVAEWEKAGLRIKPLELILQILSILSDKYDQGLAYITPDELIKIIIPLAGSKAALEEYAEAVILYREGKLDISNWPDCAPAANDRRMAREFLIFLENYGICQGGNYAPRYEVKYSLRDLTALEVNELIAINTDTTNLDKTTEDVSSSYIPSEIERRKVIREILDRPNQPAFRKMVLDAFNSKCLITGVELESVLEAAHIIPASFNGPDELGNGLCLRSDIHLLFDRGHLRITPDGNISLSDTAARIVNYGLIDRRVELPKFVNRDYLDWRLNYQ